MNASNPNGHMYKINYVKIDHNHVQKQYKIHKIMNFAFIGFCAFNPLTLSKQELRRCRQVCLGIISFLYDSSFKFLE